MMKKYSAIVFASTLALALTACGGGDAPVEEETTGSTPAATEEVATADSVADPNATADAPIRSVPFNTPSGDAVTSPIKSRNLDSLIPSSTKDARLNSSTSGKPDPFAGRVLIVRPVTPEPGDIDGVFPLAGTGQSPASDRAVGLGGIGALPANTTGPNARSRNAVGRPSPNAGKSNSSGASSSPRTSNASSGSSGSKTNATANNKGKSGSGKGSTVADSGRSGRNVGSSSNAPSGLTGGSSTTPNSSSSGSDSSTSASGGVAETKLPDLAARPPIPEPTLARAVEVTGIVLIGSNYQAIVKAPEEPTSRYVSVGQRLSNGKVLVKRIESQGSEPVVILEEEGVEVVRSIGAPTEADVAADTTATLPLPPAS